MVVVGAALIVVGAAFDHLWGTVRVIVVLAGVVLVILGFLLALGIKGFKIKASAGGGIEATADIPVGYTKKMTVSESLVEGTSPPKQGTMPPKTGNMPPKEGIMPPKEARRD